ncbi:hypothetical protein [Crocosphaera sp.]|uniref:hypothetical protein n=1 Tax=Crocosphaera sp. TaxID=2729996 RepID=UPI00263090C7|nr:hypothetical protein [Crocosphaera sp.]MDJ0581919.1 hypothetical protein [Crocosphaera sp.]
MNAQIYNTRLAFLLALSDLKTPLNEEEKETLANIAQQLDIQPLAWKDYTEPMLLKMIQSNPQLSEQYNQYKTKLETLPETSQILSGIDQEIQALILRDDPMRAKGFKPSSKPTEYDSQINNLVVVVSRSQEPENAVKTVSCLDKLKQTLGNLGQ